MYLSVIYAIQFVGDFRNFVFIEDFVLLYCHSAVSWH